MPNPFNREKYFVSLKKENVAAFVFWSKNFRPFFRILDDLDKRGFDKKIFQFTITGHNKVWMEPNIPDNSETMKDFMELSRRYGKDVMFWRYDPVVFTGIFDLNNEKTKFKSLAERLAVHTNGCILSIAQFYYKVKRAAGKLQAERGIRIYDPEIEQKRDYALHLVEWAKESGLTLRACCCDYLLDTPGIEQAHCIDGDLICRLWYPENKFKLQPSRKGCGCAESADIGEYGTCKSGCIYCYAR